MKKTTFLAAAAALFLCTSPRPYPLPALLRAPGRFLASGATRPAPQGHSHNDYEQNRPLWDALDLHYGSVEADLWFPEGRILVSHLGYSFIGSLQELYLDPLQNRVRHLGSVYGDGKPFLLWLDIKSRDLTLIPALHELLARYPMLHGESASGTQAAVQIILTGNSLIKRGYAKAYPQSGILHDALWFDEEDAMSGSRDAWQWYSLNWFNSMKWDGEGDIPEKELSRLKGLVQAIHRKHRKLRFWGTPETLGIWRASMEAGVDLINVNDLPGFRHFAGP